MRALRITIVGGGPVGLTLALLLDHDMGESAAVTVYDGRWTRAGRKVRWRGPEMGNERRQQVVTVQSRQYLRLPRFVRSVAFADGLCSEMWPVGPDSIDGAAPRNIRICDLEDRLLALANRRASLVLVPEPFDASASAALVRSQDVLAICDGAQSATREHFRRRFGAADELQYSIAGVPLEDHVLGLQVRSRLPDSMAVLLTAVQNRFLLNSLHGSGFLNMRLTDEETAEAVGVTPHGETETRQCIQSDPCLMHRDAEGDEFRCATHRTLFLPALLGTRSRLWQRIVGGLRMFGVPDAELSAVTSFRLAMVQRPRFTAELFPPSAEGPGTFGVLLGDAANALHFWPGRGLNSGLASAISLARVLAAKWNGRGLRAADLMRHEGVMAMLQYRHKTRAWRAMTVIGEAGEVPIKERIADAIRHDSGPSQRAADIDELMRRLRHLKHRLAGRLRDLPSDEQLLDHLAGLDATTLRTSVASGPWDTTGGEEVDVDVLTAAPWFTRPAVEGVRHDPPGAEVVHGQFPPRPTRAGSPPEDASGVDAV
jgi:2-polyprenyl-6-methoxyphenol hydroxylase-like FAD-dependent oxidoreductase